MVVASSVSILIRFTRDASFGGPQPVECMGSSVVAGRGASLGARRGASFRPRFGWGRRAPGVQYSST